MSYWGRPVWIRGELLVDQRLLCDRCLFQGLSHANSTIRTLFDQIADLGLQEVSDPQQVLASLNSVHTPYKRHGIRHQVSEILVIAVCAVAAGAGSFAAMVEWVGDTAAAPLAGIGVGAAHDATIDRTFSRLDSETLKTALEHVLLIR
jgi:hypothetical protein